MNNEFYIEVSIYQLKSDVAEADFLTLSDQVSADFVNFEGFQHRDLMRSEDNQWVDLVYWQDKESAKANEAALYANPIINDLMNMLDTEMMVFTHVHPVKRYESQTQ